VTTLDKTQSQAKADDRAHVFHSWSAQAVIDPAVVVSGEGSWFTTEDGTRYLDFASQLVYLNLGHQHPRLVAAIKCQADVLSTVAPQFANDKRGELARMISGYAPGDLDMVFFTNGGAEALENAVRMSRLHTGRHKILTTYRSYHGSTSGAIAATGDPRRWPSEQGATGFVHFWGPYAYRSQFYSTSEAQEGERALAHLRDVLMVEGPQTVAAIALETVVGTNGILVPPDGYLQGVRDLCDEHGIVMICDEVMAGFGRCGDWFAINRWGVTPDLICFAKGVNSGYVPLGGVVISRRIAETFQQRPYPGGLTYSGHPLACAVGVECLKVIAEEGVLEHVRHLEQNVLQPELNAIASRHPSVGDVRGVGMFWALELVRNRETREPLVPFNASGPAAAPMNEFAAACKAQGLWPFVHFNRTHVVPPLNISEADLRHGLSIIDEALSVTDNYVTS
jgi:taurine--2-oxoglutarate transaminase